MRSFSLCRFVTISYLKTSSTQSMPFSFVYETEGVVFIEKMVPFARQGLPSKLVDPRTTNIRFLEAKKIYLYKRPETSQKLLVVVCVFAVEKGVDESTYDGFYIAYDLPLKSWMFFNGLLVNEVGSFSDSLGKNRLQKSELLAMVCEFPL